MAPLELIGRANYRFDSALRLDPAIARAILEARSIVIAVSPSINAEGRQAYSGRGQLFDSRQDGRIIVERSPQPFFDSARVLIAEGCDPNTMLEMWHVGAASYALRGPLGAAARLMVADNRYGTPKVRRWQAHPDAPPSATPGVPVTLPMRQTDRPVLSSPPLPGSRTLIELKSINDYLRSLPLGPGVFPGAAELRRSGRWPAA